MKRPKGRQLSKAIALTWMLAALPCAAQGQENQAQQNQGQEIWGTPEIVEVQAPP